MVTVEVNCACCCSTIKYLFSQKASGEKKISLTDCCSAPVCSKCSSGIYRFCPWCSCRTSTSKIRKTGISRSALIWNTWHEYYNSLEDYSRAINQMPLIFFFLRSYPRRMKWNEMLHGDSKLLYDHYMQTIMRLHLFARFQTLNLKVVNPHSVAKVSAEYMKFNQSLTASSLSRNPRRRHIIQALFGFITTIVMRLLLENSESIKLVYQVIPMMIRSILKRYLSKR